VEVMERVCIGAAYLRVKVITEEESVLGTLVMETVFNLVNLRFRGIPKGILIKKHLLHYQKGVVGEYDALGDGGGINALEGVR
jgi:hypothetical protein